MSEEIRSAAPLPVIARQGDWVRIDQMYFNAGQLTGIELRTFHQTAPASEQYSSIAIWCGASKLICGVRREHHDQTAKALMRIIGGNLSYLYNRKESGGHVHLPASTPPD